MCTLLRRGRVRRQARSAALAVISAALLSLSALAAGGALPPEPSDVGTGAAAVSWLARAQTSVPEEAVSQRADEATAAGDGLTIGPNPGKGFVRLPGHVLAALHRATLATADDAGVLRSPAEASGQRVILTLVLQRDDPLGFEHYMREVYDPHSPRFRRFLTPAQLSARFGPTRKTYASLTRYLHRHGFELVESSANRLTVTVRGTRRQVERTFRLHLRDYTLGTSHFYANDADPALPALLARHVRSISGLSDLATARPVTVNQALNYCGAVSTVAGAIIIFPLLALVANVTGAICTGVQIGLSWHSGDFTSPNAALNYCGVIGSFSSLWAGIINALCNGIQIGMDPGFGQTPGSAGGANPPGASNGPSAKEQRRGEIQSTALRSRPMRRVAASARRPDGTGQTIGLLEFDTFDQGDVSDYLTLIGAPSSRINDLSKVDVNGGVATPGPGQDEVLLDIAVAMAVAPGAKIAVYDAPFDGKAASYAAVFNAMINGGVTVIGNSWASCEDQVSQADAQAIDAVLKSAAASGISVFNGAGDSGTTCLDGAGNTIAVPADSPNATAVGGTSLTLGTGYVYGSETWWNGVSSTPPTGQGGFGTSRYFGRPSYQDGLNSSPNRSIPDVSVDADPASGYLLCEANNGGCPNGKLYGGTSAAAPTWAAFAALLNEEQGKPLGALNPLIYPFASTSAFNDAGSMGSDFAHVGLGSPNLDALYLMLNHQTAGAPDPAVSELTYASTLRAGHQSTPLFTVPADGTTSAVFVVTLRDANGHTVSGKQVALATTSGTAKITAVNDTTSVSNGAAVFTVADTVAEKVQLTASDVTDGFNLQQGGLVVFGVPAPTSAGLNALPTSVPADGTSTTTLTITLQDALGRPTPGKQISLSQGSGNSVITGPSPSVTDSNGQIQFTATDDVNETVTYTALDVTDGYLPIPGSGVVTFSGSAASACTSNPPSGANGYAVTTFASGFPASPFSYSNINFANCPGAVDPFFTPSGTVLVGDFRTGDLYQLPSTGGGVSSSQVLVNLGPTLGTPVYGKDGNIYATRFATGGGFTTGDVIQLDPTTGAIVRELATGLTCPSALVTDPLSGDLFFDDNCYGGGSDNPSIWRISNPGGSSPTVSVYATLPVGGGQQQMVFSPNGTLYAVSGGGGNTEAVVQVAGTNTPSPAVVTTLAGATPDNGSIAVAATNADGSAKSLLIHVAGTNGGSLETVDISGSTLAVDTVWATGDIGAGVVGPDGCYYVGGHHLVYKLAPSTGQCGLTPTSPGPALTLSAATSASNPTQGSAETFTATLKNVSSPSGVPVLFQVGGVNSQVRIVRTDSGGNASFTYTAASAGADTIIAVADVTTGGSKTEVVSNSTQVSWAAGTHVTFLSLNGSPKGGVAGATVSLVASLTDTSVSPAAPVAGESIAFALGSQNCTGTTDASGVATCQLTVPQAGSSALTASFTGDSQFSSASDSAAFNAAAAAAPADFTLSASPTSLTAMGGQSAGATLTVTPSGGFNQAVTFSCSGLPAGATCSFSPSSVTPNGSAVATTLTISTTARTALLWTRGGVALAGGMLLLGVHRRRRGGRASRRHLRRRWMRRALVLLAAAGLASCTSHHSPQSTGIGTPAGQSMVTVTAASSGAGAVQHSVALTLTVQ